MSLPDVVEIGRKVIRENPELFEALLRYERTKKIPKLNYKTRANFTLDSDIFRKFRNYCNDKGLSMSRIVEKHIKDEVSKTRL